MRNNPKSFSDDEGAAPSGQGIEEYNPEQLKSYTQGNVAGQSSGGRKGRLGG